MKLLRIGLIGCAMGLITMSAAIEGEGPLQHCRTESPEEKPSITDDIGSRSDQVIAGQAGVENAYVWFTDGNIEDFGGFELVELGPGSWLCEEGQRSTLVTAVEETLLMAIHNDGSPPTLARLDNVTPQEFMRMANPELMFNARSGCLPPNTVCTCTVEPPHSCGPVSRSSVACCEPGEICTCKLLWNGSQTCVTGVLATCEDPS